VRRFVGSITSSDEIEWGIKDKVLEYLKFFDYESNQYLLNTLSDKCRKLLEAFDNLGEFTGNHFYPKEVKAASELWIPSEYRFNYEWPEDIWKEYHVLEPPLHDLANKVNKVYEVYRSTIRETLFI
jgi:hypothetical protein